MTPVESLIDFTVAAVVVTLIPGLDTALVLKTVATEGGRAAGGAAAGILLGCLLWGFAAAFGASTVMASSEWAFEALRWTGTAYLTWVGFNLLLVRERQTEIDSISHPGANRQAAWFRRGVLTNLLNPKVGAFYLSFLPQFVPTGVQAGSWMVLLATIHAFLGCCWFALLIGAGSKISPIFRASSHQRAADRVAGTIFLAFALRLATSRR